MEHINNIPEELKELKNWLVWRLEDTGRDKPAKVPYSVHGGRGKTNDPATWGGFSEAAALCEREGYNGVGFVFTSTPYVGIDIDGCIDPATGEISQEAADIIETAQSYTEVSQSGRGFHIILRGKLPEGKRRQGPFEMYGGGSPRYFALTGNVWGRYPAITEGQAAIDAVHTKYINTPEKAAQKPAEGAGGGQPVHLEDGELLARAFSARNGGAFLALYGGEWSGKYSSQSEADIAFCNMLAFWTGCDDEQMDRIFRTSGLMRPKWDEMRGVCTYGQKTITEACDKCETVYQLDPRRHIAELAAGAEGKTLADLRPEKTSRYGWHDMGSSYLFADWYRDKARYAPERKKWFVYNGRVWEPDTGDLKTMELCKKLADNLMVYALSLEDEQIKQDYIKFAGKWQRRAYRETILKDAASVYPISISAFDADPFLFNCQNGTLDLRTRTFRQHNAADLLSKIAGVEYAAGASSARWERFIDEVMQGDREKAAFLQKALGYALTGDTRHECFFLLYGPTSRNGKGTTMETYMRLMGDYGRTAKPDTITQKQTANGSGPSEDIARLAGARFVNISEPDKKMVLSAALVKTLTGNDTVTARFLNENSFEFRPQFKLFINTNHLPATTDTTLFSSGRVKVIPFERHFSESERDKGLKLELAEPENLSGILNWCMEGLRKIDAEGFEPPDAVLAATDEYRKNTDKIERFLEDEMTKDAQGGARTAEVYARYKEWCYKNNYFPENAANFKTSLAKVGTVCKRRPKGCDRLTPPVHMFLGYRLNTDFKEIDEPLPLGW